MPLNATKTRWLSTLVEPLEVIENYIWRNYRAGSDAGYAAMPVR